MQHDLIVFEIYDLKHGSKFKCLKKYIKMIGESELSVCEQINKVQSKCVKPFRGRIGKILFFEKYSIFINELQIGKKQHTKILKMGSCKSDFGSKSPRKFK